MGGGLCVTFFVCFDEEWHWNGNTVYEAPLLCIEARAGCEETELCSW